jgi:hypothetical protein
MITGIAHVNLVVPPGTLDFAREFYCGTLGFQSATPPAILRDVLAWYAGICLMLRNISYEWKSDSFW